MKVITLMAARLARFIGASSGETAKNFIAAVFWQRLSKSSVVGGQKALLIVIPQRELR
jgi:hypothetical protein